MSKSSLSIDCPIVVGGASSSGTTLLATILSRHSQLACGAELSCFDRASLYDRPWHTLRWSLSIRPQQRIAVEDLRWNKRLFQTASQYGLSSTDLRLAVARSGSFRELLDRIASSYLRRSGKFRWVEKTPSNIYCASRFLHLYPKGIFVNVIRDGRDCVVSQLRRGRSLAHSGTIWLTSVAAAHSLAGHPRVVTVRYEELAERPEATIQSLCDRLRIENEGSLLTPGTLGAKSVHSTWASRPDQPINTRSVGRHVRQMDAAMEEWFFSMSLTKVGVERYRSPFSTVPEALTYYGYNCSREEYPEQQLDYVLRRPMFSLRQRAYRALTGWKADPDHVEQPMVEFEGC